VFWTILNRAIFFELVKVFVFALVAMTGILAMAGIVTYASQQGLSPAQILAITPLIIPDMLPYSIPTTMLFATCIVYGRLAADNEILAIKTAGINILRVVGPAVFLGLVMSATTLGLYYHVIPYTHRLMKSLFMNDVEELLYAMLKKDGEIKRPELNYSMWVRRVQGRRLQDCLFKRRDGSGRYDVLAKAAEAELSVDLQARKLVVRMWNGHLSTEGNERASILFSYKEWEVPLPHVDAKAKLRTRDMTWEQIRERRFEAAREADGYAADLALKMARGHFQGPPRDLPAQLASLKMVYQHRALELNSLDAELQMRPALSFGCLCFVLVGCPVGIWLSRSDYLSAFITCFLPIAFIYYPLILCGNNLARDGKLPAMPAIWGANAIMAFIALLLFRRLIRN
jgi:lipopolysaccharide export system permease protein